MIMNWILIMAIVLLTERSQNSIYIIFGTNAGPLPITRNICNINPYIKHWQPAQFDRSTLEEAHLKHLDQKQQRMKREVTNQFENGPAHKITLRFGAYEREFNLILYQNPLSVFAPDIEIENTSGPVNYDILRVYSGKLEDDENSQVHAVLTKENLIDGTILTASEMFYIEPSERYSKKLSKLGVHTIIYKLSDVKLDKNFKYSLGISESKSKETNFECGSQKLFNYDLKTHKIKSIPTTSNKITRGQDNFSRPLENFHRSILSEKKRVNFQIYKSELKTSFGKQDSSIEDRQNPDFFKQIDERIDIYNSNNLQTYIFSILNKKRYFHFKEKKSKRKRRWLENEFIEKLDPVLPLDLEQPYNQPATPFDMERNQTKKYLSKGKEMYNNENINFSEENRLYSKNFLNLSMLKDQLESNPNNDEKLYKNFNKSNGDDVSNPNSNGSEMKNIYSNIIGNTYYNENNNYNINTKIRSIFNKYLNLSDKTDPSHKTHVEIITRNWINKKPNIIGNKYHPDNHIFPHLKKNKNALNNSSESIDPPVNTFQPNRKSTCMLYLQADHTFFQKMGSDEASIEAITRHVQRANSIYQNTDFDNDGKPDNITFMIKRIKIHNLNAMKDPTYRFPGNYGVEKFLELFSEEDYDAFCLAYMFTYRDFEMGTLGLAWTGDLKNAGGVCEKNGHYRGSLKSLNTGIVTLLNYGKHVPPAVSHVTLAHEIGHNFGSPHDPEQCTPGGEDGNYIMFARATSGDKRNNNKFSPCSLKSIQPVLNTKARSLKGCFTELQTSICGNGVVEPGEECDCGWEEDCFDRCCFPMSQHAKTNERPCSLRPKALCSPSQGPCCTTECNLKYGDKCRDDNGCRDPSYCNGRQAECPPSINKPNKTICNKEFVCYMGECTGSICLAFGLESCQCIPGPNAPKTKSCELCCKEPGENKQCKSSFEWNEQPYDVPDMFAKPGTPCNDYNGYCDVFQKCREVDPSGPLATLRNLLLSDESLATFKKWIQFNWYIAILAATGLLSILIVSTKLLTKQNGKLKPVTIIHTAPTEPVRLPENNDGVITHTAIQTKVPLKKKVRMKRKAESRKGKKSYLKTQNYVSFIKPELKNQNKKTTKKNNSIVKEDQFLFKHNTKSNKNKSYVKKDEKVDFKPSKKVRNSHSNTLGKVQKWLLDSQMTSTSSSKIPSCSVKLRNKVIKSLSTPENLVSTIPKKTKSMDNINTEKVKLQIVYNLPFKFLLKFSKNQQYKTNIVNETSDKNKNKSDDNKKNISETYNKNTRKHGHKAILLIKSINKDETRSAQDIQDRKSNETLSDKANEYAQTNNVENIGDFVNLEKRVSQKEIVKLNLFQIKQSETIPNINSNKSSTKVVCANPSSNLFSTTSAHNSPSLESSFDSVKKQKSKDLRRKSLNISQNNFSKQSMKRLPKKGAAGGALRRSYSINGLPTRSSVKNLSKNLGELNLGEKCLSNKKSIIYYPLDDVKNEQIDKNKECFTNMNKNLNENGNNIKKQKFNKLHIMKENKTKNIDKPSNKDLSGILEMKKKKFDIFNIEP